MTTATKGIDLLPASRTHANRSFEWFPSPSELGLESSGRLELTQSKKTTAFALTLVPTDWPGIAVRLDKMDSRDSYHVYVGPEGDSCDCPGYCWASKSREDKRHGKPADKDDKACRHLTAVHGLILNGWLHHPSEGPDA